MKTGADSLTLSGGVIITDGAAEKVTVGVLGQASVVRVRAPDTAVVKQMFAETVAAIILT